MRELPLHKPMTFRQRLMQAILRGLRKVVPQRKPPGYVSHPPDSTLEAALREHLSFLFSDCGARIVQSQTGTIVIECGGFRLKTIRERDSLVFFIAPTTRPQRWENADIAMAAASGEDDRDVVSDRTSLTCLAGALEPRLAALQSAFSSEHISRTEEVMDRLQHAAEERSRSSYSR